MATTGRAPIKIGSGYIEIVPQLSTTGLKTFRDEFTKQMTTTGDEGAKALSTSFQKGLNATVTALRASLGKMEDAVKASAASQAGFVTDSEKDKQKVYQTTADLAIRAISSQEDASKAAVQTELRNQQQIQAAIDRSTDARTAAHDLFMRQLADETAAVRSAMTAQTRATTTATTSISRSVAGSNKSIAKSFKSIGESTHKYSSSLAEVGSAITNNLVLPLAAVSAALTDIGVKFGDSLIQGQKSLQALGITQKDAGGILSTGVNTGIQTPYSVKDITAAEAKLARSFSAENKGIKSNNPDTNAAASKDVSKQTTATVQNILDLLAHGGKTDEKSLTGTFQAYQTIQDQGKILTRNVRQFANDANVPTEEIAQALGYKDSKSKSASAQLLGDLTKGKVISNTKFEDAVSLLGNDPQVKGASAQIGSTTVGNRIQQFKESSENSLSHLFVTQNKKTGQFSYSGLGAKIFGQPITDKKGNTIGYDGEGLLDQVQTLSQQPEFKKTIKTVLTQFVSGIQQFVKILASISKVLGDHPKIVAFIGTFTKWAAILGPVLIAVGVFGKLLGNIIKVLSPVVKLGAGLVNLARGRGFSGNGGSNGGNGGSGSGSGGGSGSGNVGNQVTQQAELTRAINESNDAAKNLLQTIDKINRASIKDLIDQFSGSGGNNLVQVARTSEAAIARVRDDAITPLNDSKLNKLQQEFTTAREDASLLITEIKAAVDEVGKLDVQKLTSLKVTFDSAKGSASDLKSEVNDVITSVKRLDGLGLGTVQHQFKDLTSDANGTYDKIGDGKGNSLSGRVRGLDGMSLSSIQHEFKTLTGDVTDTYSKVGTTKISGTLSNRISGVNGLSLASITKKVDALGDSLGVASAAAKGLDHELDNIASDGGGSGSNKSKKKPKGLSTGGVLPGYQPGVDTIPAMLSAGESVLRPEVTRALGASTINSWNQAAMSGKLQRFAGGGVVAQLGQLKQAVKDMDIWPDALAGLSGAALDGTSEGVGGRAQDGILGTVAGASRHIGTDIADKFGRLGEFASRDSWDILKRVPTVVGQVVGILGGAMAPQLGSYFHDDIWKGKGNILDRGGKFLGDTFSTKTLTSAIGNLFGGLWDSVKSIFSTGKDLITDPIGTVGGAVDAIWDMGKSDVDGAVDMVKSLKSLITDPSQYIGNVVSDVWSTAKDAAPNTNGLFNFSNSGTVKGTKPDINSLLGGGGTVPGGSGVSRWLPTVDQVLGLLHVPLTYANLILHRIGVESGGNPNAINLTDSNAKAGHPSQGLMQTIPSTFATYAGPFKGLGITNPLASIYAGLNYAMHRYGGGWPQALSGTKGYWMGTRHAAPGMALVGERGPELVNFGAGGAQVHNAKDTASMLSGSGKNYNITVNEAKSEDTTQATIRALKYMENLYGI